VSGRRAAQRRKILDVRPFRQLAAPISIVSIIYRALDEAAAAAAAPAAAEQLTD